MLLPTIYVWLRLFSFKRILSFIQCRLCHYQQTSIYSQNMMCPVILPPCKWNVWLIESPSFSNTSQRCPQALAHSDFAIYSCWLRYLLIPNYFRIIVTLIKYALSTHKSCCRVLSTLQNSLSTLKFRDTPAIWHHFFWFSGKEQWPRPYSHTWNPDRQNRHGSEKAHLTQLRYVLTVKLLSGFE